MKIALVVAVASSVFAGAAAANPIVYTTSGTILPYDDAGYTTVLDVDLAKFPIPAATSFDVRVSLDYKVLLTGVAYHDLNPPGTVVSRALATKLIYVASGAFPPDLKGFNYTFLVPTARAGEPFAVSSWDEHIGFHALTDKYFDYGDTHLLFVAALDPNDRTGDEFQLNWSATYTATLAFVPEATSMQTAMVAFAAVAAVRARRARRPRSSFG